MAPEQIRSDKVDARTDVYALGVLAFHMLTGRYPFEAADPVEIAMQHLQAPPPRPSDSAPISPALDGVVLRCLEKVPAKRFQSATDLLAAFRTAVGHAGENVAESEWGVGIYFEVKTDDEEGELDDDMLMDIGNVMDTIEQALAESGCVFPFRTSNALLGVRMVGSKEAAEQAREDVAASLEQWHAILENRPDRHPGVQVTASLSVGQALCRHGASGDEIVGGPLLDFETWKDDDFIRLG
jgi:serine/threonine-protein kinase